MDRTIFLLRENDELLEMGEQHYESEDLLQRLLENHPNLLAGAMINRASPRRWLLIKREVGVPGEEGGGGRWSADHLFLDQDAVPTLVEVKRSTDTRIRREVVGQMLDYAANAAVFWSLEFLKASFESTCEKRGDDPDTALADFLGQEEDADEFWQQAKTNLQAGRLRLLFVADEIPPELRRIIEFLNEQMDPAEILGIEIKQFATGGLRTLVPSVLGQTEEAIRKKTAGGSRGGPQWTEERFFEHLALTHSAEEVGVARQLLDWSHRNATRVLYGRGSTAGSFVPVYDHESTEHQLFAVWSYGTLQVYFYWYQFKPPFDREEVRLRLLERLNEIPGVALPEEAIRKRPGLPLKLFTDPEKLSALLGVFEHYLRIVRGQESP